MQDDNLKRLNEKKKNILIIFVYKANQELIIFKLYNKYKRKIIEYFNNNKSKKMNVSIQNRYHEF